MTRDADWHLISEVAEDCRERFLDLATADAFATRARLHAEDVVDTQAMLKMQATYIAEFAEMHGGESDPAIEQRFRDGLAAIGDRAPLMRREIENEQLTPWLWNFIRGDEKLWADSSSVRQSGRFYAIFSGIEFDFEKAKRFGVRINSAEAAGFVKLDEAGKARKLRGHWPAWIASVASLASDGKVHGSLTETELYNLIADDMALQGISQMSRSTVQDAANAILNRFRHDGIFS